MSWKKENTFFGIKWIKLPIKMHVASYIFCFDQIFAFAWCLKRNYKLHVFCCGGPGREMSCSFIISRWSLLPPYTFTPMSPATRTQVAPTDPRFSLRTPAPTISQYSPKDVCSKCFAGKRLGLAWNLAGPAPAVKYSSVNTRELHQITSPTKPLAATPRDLVRHLLFYCRIGPV